LSWFLSVIRFAPAGRSWWAINYGGHLSFKLEHTDLKHCTTTICWNELKWCTVEIHCPYMTRLASCALRHKYWSVTCGSVFDGYYVACMGEIRKAYKILVWKPEGNRLLGRPRSRWDENIRMDQRKYGRKVWTGFICFRIGTSGRLLWRRQWTFGFHKRLRTSWLAEWLLASQEGLCPIDIVS
jgi:hypothetical protein